MLLKRFYDDALAQASYLVGAETTGQAIVIDPNRDVDQYLRAAADEGLRVSHVTETHIHADFVSGSRELARRAGARLLLSGEGDAAWQYRFAHEENAMLLKDGSHFQVGEVRFDVLHTPGHTPEHIVLFVTDEATANRPMGVFTGDFIFVGDVGRPDLLERAARETGTMERSARALFHSLRRLRDHPEYLQLWPGHGAGSACGKALGAVPSTTLGYERLFNWAFAIGDEAEFVHAVLAGQPEPPRYFARMKIINRDNQPVWGDRSPPPQLEGRSLETLVAGAHANTVAGDTQIVDARPAATFAAGFIPGTLNIPAGKLFTTWAGSLLDYDRDVVLLVEEEDAGGEHATALARQLAMIGHDRVTAWGGSAVFEGWHRAGGRLEKIPSVDAQTLAARDPSELQLIDVRGDAEWREGHIPGARHLFLGDLDDASAELRRDLPIVVSCQGGTRSSIAASLLRARGFIDVQNFAGGFAEWKRLGLPVSDGSDRRHGTSEEVD